MQNQRKILLFCIFVIAGGVVMPAYAEVTSLHANRTFYKMGDKIIFSGTVAKTDFEKQVSLVIYDPNKSFVLITGGFSDVNSTFQIVVDTNGQNQFSVKGTYNATAFIYKESNGTIASFDFSPDGSPVIHAIPQKQNNSQSTPQLPVQNPPATQSTPPQNTATGTTNGTQSISQMIQQRIENAKKQQELLQSLSQQPGQNTTLSNSMSQHSISLSENVDLNDISKNNSITKIPNAIQMPSNYNNILYPFIAALGGVGIVIAVLFSRKNRTANRANVSQIEEPQPEKLTDSLEDDYALSILKNRLAKGEISIEEFNALKDALKEP